MKLAARRLPVKVKYIYNQRWLCKPALVPVKQGYNQRWQGQRWLHE
jgi:hypothetical protein